MGEIFFISKKDTFYSFAIWGAIILGLTVIVDSSFSSSFLSVSYWIALILVPILIVWLIWIWFSAGYRVKNNTLRIEAGLLKQTIDIQEIRKITREKSILTSGALSIDRLQIQYGKYKYVGISPKKEYEFIKLLLSKNPQIQIDNALFKLYKLWIYKVKVTATNRHYNDLSLFLYEMVKDIKGFLLQPWLLQLWIKIGEILEMIEPSREQLR